MQNKNLIQSFVKMSQYVGAREDLIQAGGGNTAVKLDDCNMAIKASGYQLSELKEDNGYAIVNYKTIRDAFLEIDDFDLLTEEKTKEILAKAFLEGKRPSIETFLHSIVGKFSLHTHPILVNALTCRSNGEKILCELFDKPLIVPYATPGAELAKAYFKAYKIYKDKYHQEPIYIFLMNHGLIVSGETAEDAISLTENVTQTIEKYLGVDFSEYRAKHELERLYDSGIIWKVTDSNVLEGKKQLGTVWRHFFCPDAVVFLGKSMYDVKTTQIDESDFGEFVRENGFPVVICYKGSMYIHADNVKKALEIQSVLSFCAQVLMLNRDEEVVLLSEEEKNFLLNWEVEKYRKNM